MNEISSGIVYRFTGYIFVKQYTRIIYLFYDSQYTTILPINTFISPDMDSPGSPAPPGPSADQILFT